MLFDNLPFHEDSLVTMTYAGIGSRETPLDILNLMAKIAEQLENLGYTLNSGGAKGADTAFEKGVKNILHKNIFYANDANDITIEIAKEIHPAPEKLSPYALKLMARNTFQIFGRKLDRPVDFVICWTKDGKEGFGKDRPWGGTGQAVEMAARKNIPVINLKNNDALVRLSKLTDFNFIELYEEEFDNIG